MSISKVDQTITGAQLLLALRVMRVVSHSPTCWEGDDIDRDAIENPMGLVPEKAFALIRRLYVQDHLPFSPQGFLAHLSPLIAANRDHLVTSNFGIVSIVEVFFTPRAGYFMSEEHAERLRTCHKYFSAFASGEVVEADFRG